MQDLKQNLSHLTHLTIGIDAGNFRLRAAYVNPKNSRAEVICACENFLELRENCEIFFNDFVDSCVLSLSENLHKLERDKFLLSAKTSGFDSVKVIDPDDAIISSIACKTALVFDIGKANSRAIVAKDNHVHEKILFPDLSGDSFDRIFAEWLRERFLLSSIDSSVLHDAENLKIALSESEHVIYRHAKISRYDFERLIRFQIRKILHTLRRLESEYSPEKIFFTGSSCKLPIILESAKQILTQTPEFHDNLAAKSAALKIPELFTNSSPNPNPDSNTSQRVRNLRHDLISLEEILTRSQKDKLYNMFSKNESGNSDTLTILENLMNELKTLKTHA